MTRAVETTDIISKHLPGECGQPQAPQQQAGLRVASAGAPESPLLRRCLHGQHRPAEGRRPHRARPACVALEAGGCGKVPAAVVSCPRPRPRPGPPAPQPPPAQAPRSAPSSITRTGPGSRRPSAVTSTGRTPSSRRTVTRSSSATPTSSATSCAGEGSHGRHYPPMAWTPPTGPGGFSGRTSHGHVFLVG